MWRDDDRYLLKSYILFGDRRHYDMWLKSLQALDQHSAYGPWHAEVDMHAGRSTIRPLVVSSLQAFWPALLVLAGDIDQAQLTFKGYYDLWNVYGSLPEGYQVCCATRLLQTLGCNKSSISILPIIFPLPGKNRNSFELWS